MIVRKSLTARVIFCCSVGEDVTKQLLTINQQESSLKKADELLNKVVDRTTKKLYPELNFEQTTAAERRELIKETNSEQTIFKGSELAVPLIEVVKSYLIIKKAATIFMPARLCQKALF